MQSSQLEAGTELIGTIAALNMALQTPEIVERDAQLIRANGPTVAGNSSANNLRGAALNDYMQGNGGNDTYVGAAGDDLMLGGADTDVAVYSGPAANFTVTPVYSVSSGGALIGYRVKDKTGVEGTDALNQRMDYLQFGDSSERFKLDAPASITLPFGATNGHDTLTGTSDNDSLEGIDGNDVLIGDAGDDTLSGGKGTDIALFNGAYSNFRITPLYDSKNSFNGYTVQDLRGKEGTDTVEKDVEYLSFDQGKTRYKSSNGTLTLDTSPGDVGGDVLGATSGNDTLTGTSGPNTMNGGDGDDVLIGLGGDDKINGSKGSDTAQYAGTYSNFKITPLYDGKTGAFTGYKVEDNSGLEGIDSIGKDVEFLSFNSGNTLYRSDNGALTLLRSGTNTITGGASNDVLNATAGDDAVDGGAGVDTLVFGAKHSAFTVTKGTNDSLSIKSTLYGSDTVAGVERLQFADKWFANDLGGAAGTAAKVVFAAFGTEQFQKHFAAGIALADAHNDLKAVSAALMEAKLTDAISIGGTTKAFVDTVFRNVVGRDPDASEFQFYANLVDSGSISKPDLLALAAAEAITAQGVDTLKVELVGLPYDPAL